MIGSRDKCFWELVSLNRGRSFKLGWLLLLITGIGILGFGIVVLSSPQVLPGYSGPIQEALLRTVGVATIGMGFFGLALTWMALRRGETWSWFALWFYPLFWISHLAGLGVRPGADDALFIVISVLGLLLTARQRETAFRKSRTSSQDERDAHRP
jgi:hypothetical protein